MATNRTGHLSAPVRELVRSVQKFHYAKRPSETFRAFLRLSFCAVAQRTPYVTPEQREALEADYMAEIGKWAEAEDRHRFPQMFATLANAMAVGYEDVLGPVAAELEALNAGAGQFFTPWEVCRLMAGMTTDLTPLNDKPYMTVMEPAAGSGAMVLAVADTLRTQGHSPTLQMHVTAVDIDVNCVHMAYLQMALAGIPARVVHGNALTREEWGSWHTPAVAPFMAEHATYHQRQHAVANVRKRTRK